MIKQPYIAYYRVSTEEQGESGLGLAAQKKSVTSFTGENGILVGEFTDVESGASDTRQGMIDAIEACKMYNATLVVKELSRITRGGYGFRDMLDKSEVKFIEAGSPHDPEVVKDIKFALAKEERTKIRQRTRDALSEIKTKIDNGIVHISKAGNVVEKLGSPQNLTNKARIKSAEVRSKKAKDNPFNVRAGALIVALKKSGKNYVQIVKELNGSGFKTSRGNDFSQVQAKRLYERYK